MTIPCQCTIIDNNMRFDRKINLCNNTTRDIQTVYPINLALLQQFFNDSQLKQVLADTSFNTSINFKFPEFKIYKHKMSKILADDTEIFAKFKENGKKS